MMIADNRRRNRGGARGKIRWGFVSNMSVRMPDGRERQAPFSFSENRIFSDLQYQGNQGEIACAFREGRRSVRRKEWGGGTVRGERSPRGIGPSPAVLPARAFLSRKFVRLQGERVNLGWWYTAV